MPLHLAGSLLRSQWVALMKRMGKQTHVHMCVHTYTYVCIPFDKEKRVPGVCVKESIKGCLWMKVGPIPILQSGGSLPR